MSKKKIKNYLIRNLCDGPRDYPLKNGESIYLVPDKKSGSIISGELISEALIKAEQKGLIEIVEMNASEEEPEEIISEDNDNNEEVIE